MGIHVNPILNSGAGRRQNDGRVWRALLYSVDKAEPGFPRQIQVNDLKLGQKVRKFVINILGQCHASHLMTVLYQQLNRGDTQDFIVFNY
ncbi:hypothetical protein [Limnohabitans sp. DM1]|uniref:hypothetical protein n=1 Tax=Limnohabitans sp. DM1 TaxID=1597955 RepID=UPI0018929D44|nr:hypothetical protein [Limnohabitans sp. DM1]